MTLSKEPIVYIGLAVIVLQVIISVINHEPITSTVIDSLIIAVGSVSGRALVTPNSKVEK